MLPKRRGPKRPLRVALRLALALACVPVAWAQDAPVRIQFERGAISAEWRGVIQRGSQAFLLRLGRMQSLTVESGDVYTWSLVGPDGRLLGCNDNAHCAPGESILLPASGDYRVQTTYRMSDCASCPVATFRRVNVVFIAR